MENLFGLSETFLTIIKVVVLFMFVGVGSAFIMNLIDSETGQIKNKYINITKSIFISIFLIILSVFLIHIFRKY